MWIVFIVAAILLLLLVSGGYVFFVACRRRKELPWFVKEDLEKTPFGKYYETIKDADRWLRDHGAQDIWITSDDHLKLHGLWVPADKSVGTVLLVHGYRSTKLVDFGVAFAYYHERGMNLLIPDHRSHGESEGKYITFGVKESKDMLQWVQYHNENYGEYPMILSGLSMGASTVMFMADMELPANVKGIIADCGFTSPKDILASVFRNVTHLPAIPTLWITELYARIFAGFSIWEKSSEKSLANSRAPLLLIHGKADDFVPCEMTERNHTACGAEKTLLLVEDAGHGVSFLKDHKRYIACVDKFLNENLIKKEV